MRMSDSLEAAVKGSVVLARDGRLGIVKIAYATRKGSHGTSISVDFDHWVATGYPAPTYMILRCHTETRKNYIPLYPRRDTPTNKCEMSSPPMLMGG